MIVSPRCTRRAAAPLTLDLARAPLAGDRVGLKARAVVDVDHVNLLVLEDVGGLQQVGVDRDRADVVQVAVGDRRAVDLGLEHHALHVVDRLSWGRLAGDCAASAASAVGRKQARCRSGGSRRRARRAPAAPGASSVSSGSSVSGSTSARYSGATPKGRIASRAAAQQRRGGALAGRGAARGRLAARRAARARASRSSGLSRALRLDIARPSGSRTVGQASTRTGRFRSLTRRRMTTTCWASFWPK